MSEQSYAIKPELLLRWLHEATPREEDCESDFSQGVRRGFEIIIAQIEHGHIQEWIATQPGAPA